MQPRRAPGVGWRDWFGDLFVMVNVLGQPFGDQLGLDLTQKSGFGLFLNSLISQGRKLMALDACGDVLNFHEVASDGSANSKENVLSPQHRITPNALGQARRATGSGTTERRNPASPARSCSMIRGSLLHET
jgi:hypothetical protein